MKVFQLVAILSFTSLVILSFMAHIFSYFPVDLWVSRTIQSITIPGFDSLMKFITSMGNLKTAAIIVTFFAIAFIVTKRYQQTLILLISFLLLEVLGILLKDFISRPRPNPQIITQWGFYPNNDSFPSGHVLFFISLFGYLLFFTIFELKKGFLRSTLIIILSVLLLLIGISRIYLGAHWFSDVLGSYLMGIIWFYIIYIIHKKIKNLI